MTYGHYVVEVDRVGKVTVLGAFNHEQYARRFAESFDGQHGLVLTHTQLEAIRFNAVKALRRWREFQDSLIQAN